jgi:hypothetical protein
MARLVYLETADVARRAGLSATSIRMAVVSGDLPVAARTERGVRLFLPTDVACYIALAAMRRRRKATPARGE